VTICPPRVHNIRRATQLLDGRLIAGGARFSMNDALGRRTRARGFVPAPMISGGRLVDSVGGGISQVATTMFNAAFFAGLRLVAHTPHSFYISRYPKGREATVSWGGPDRAVASSLPARRPSHRSWNALRPCARPRSLRRQARLAASDELLSSELSFRERLGISLQQLTQEELDAVVKRMAGQAMNGEERSAHVLARMADQAFGRTPTAPPSEEGEETLESMTRERRAALRAVLLEEAKAVLGPPPPAATAPPAGVSL
jgi:VanW like protein